MSIIDQVESPSRARPTLHRVMSAFGTKRTSREVCSLSAFGGKADIVYAVRYVCL